MVPGAGSDCTGLSDESSMARDISVLFTYVETWTHPP